MTTRAESPAASGPAPAAAPEGPGLLRWLVVGCGSTAFFLLVALVLGRAFAPDPTVLAPAASSFFQRIDASDWEGAYALLDARGKTQVTSATFVRFCEDARAVLGGLKKRDLVQTQFSDDSAECAYLADFEKAKGVEVRLAFVRNPEWRVGMIWYRSPLLDEVRCTYCKAPTLGRPVCPRCNRAR